MRVIALFAAGALLALSEGVAQVKTPADVKPPVLLVNHRVAEYFGETYTKRSREDFVFFQGEVIAYRVAVHNMGNTESTLVLASTDPMRFFTVEALKSPPLTPEKLGAERPSFNGRYLDEVDVDVPLRVSSPFKTWPGGTFSIPLEREIRLDPKEGVEWQVHLPTDLEPGLYRIVVKVHGSDRSGRPLLSFARFRFEVRPPTPEAQPELLRRQAARLWYKGDSIAARQAVAELLKVHPNSAEAYGILGMIADREGKSAEAATHRTRANEIIQNKRDELLLKFGSQTLH